MSLDPISLTFDLLAETSRAEADELLLAALEARSAVIRDRAAHAIVARGSVRGFVELLRKFDDLSDAARRKLSEISESSSRAFQQALRTNEERLLLSALVAARVALRVDQTALVAELLKSNSSAVRQEAFETLVVLADRLHDQLNDAGGGGRPGRAELIGVRDGALDALAGACEHIERFASPAVVLERLLALGTPKHAAVTKALRQCPPSCREMAAQVLSTSRHPGVMRLLFEFFGEAYPPRCVFDAMKTRDDPEFVAGLLRLFPEEPTAGQAANFRQVDVVPWLRAPERIAEIPEGLQGKLPAFINATGLPERRKQELEEWLIRNGSAEGRKGATQVFDRLDVESTKRILLEGLESADENVSAWATSQLRPRQVPNAFRLLIDRLDDRSEVVRETAREQLRGFTIEHLLAIHERLTPELCRGAGELLRKIDPDCATKLAAVIGGPVQRQRIAAAQAAARLGMVEEVRSALLGLLRDEDATVRRAGVEVLTGDATSEVVQALRELLMDGSPRVRQAAERALAEAGVSGEVALG